MTEFRYTPRFAPDGQHVPPPATLRTLSLFDRKSDLERMSLARDGSRPVERDRPAPHPRRFVWSGGMGRYDCTDTFTHRTLSVERLGDCWYGPVLIQNRDTGALLEAGHFECDSLAEAVTETERHLRRLAAPREVAC